MPSAICSPYWCPIGGEFWRTSFGKFLACRIAEDATRCTVASSVPDKFRIFQKFLIFFSITPIDLLGGKLAPGKTRPPLRRAAR